MRHEWNQHRGDINIHYIPSDPRSTLSPAISLPPAIFFRPFSKQWYISADRFVIYGESLASRLSDEATGTATVGDSSFGSPHPAAASSTSSYPAHRNPPDFRYLSFRHSLGLVESPFSPVDRWARLPFRNHDSAKGQIFRAASFDANRNDLPHS